MKVLNRFICAALLLSCCQLAFSDVAVIVHNSNNVELGQKELSRIFLRKLKLFPGGGNVTPVNQNSKDPTTTVFVDKVLRKSSKQVKAYWSKLVFTGKGAPPDELDGDESVIAFVASNPDAIGYINVASVTSDVRVIASF